MGLPSGWYALGAGPAVAAVAYRNRSNRTQLTPAFCCRNVTAMAVGGRSVRSCEYLPKAVVSGSGMTCWAQVAGLERVGVGRRPVVTSCPVGRPPVGQPASWKRQAKVRV